MIAGIQLYCIFTIWSLAEDIRVGGASSGFPDLVAAAVASHPGLRVLRQPLWECLASFILSTVNNIPRIQRIVNRLSEEFGASSHLPDGRPGFPTAEAMAEVSIETLRECGTGFRARGLSEAAMAMASGELDEAELRGALEQVARGCCHHGARG